VRGYDETVRTAAANTDTQTEGGAAADPLSAAGGLFPPRLAREWRTIRAMVQLYCRHQHSAAQRLCPECQGLLDYAALRLERCRFGSEKPTCAKCPVHCYQKDRRAQIKTVMRFAGPRMLWQHPVLSLWHWLDSRDGGRRARQT